MDSGARGELNAIIGELNLIITELESISGGVRHSFKNIGNDLCANCIDQVASNYRNVRKKLNNLDTTTVREEYAKAHGGSGRRG